MTITGRIYKITSAQTDNVYVGSSTRTLHLRLKEHKNHFKSYKNGKANYCTSFEVIKYEDVAIQLLEEIEFDDRKELLKRERYYIETINNIINKRIPSLTQKESFKRYEDTHKEKRKQYRIDNAMNIKAKCDCECGGKYTRSVKARHFKSKKHINYITINNNNCEVKIEAL
jgi:hypothetical protein